VYGPTAPDTRLNAPLGGRMLGYDSRPSLAQTSDQAEQLLHAVTQRPVGPDFVPLLDVLNELYDTNP
jgi:hypothetical protein